MIEHKTIKASWYADGRDPFTTEVVIGDGQTIFDETYPFDDRIFFYFHNKAEFDLAVDGNADNVPFYVIDHE